jgi:hypothetical protein
MTDHWKKELENKEGLDEGYGQSQGRVVFIYLCVPCHLLVRCCALNPN